MKIESVLNDIEALVKVGFKEEAMIILREFQRETLLEYKKWFEKNYQEGKRAIRLHSFYINKFIG